VDEEIQEQLGRPSSALRSFGEGEKTDKTKGYNPKVK